jgi:hypothetical protein
MSVRGTSFGIRQRRLPRRRMQFCAQPAVPLEPAAYRVEAKATTVRYNSQYVFVSGCPPVPSNYVRGLPGEEQTGFNRGGERPTMAH